MNLSVPNSRSPPAVLAAASPASLSGNQASSHSSASVESDLDLGMDSEPPEPEPGVAQYAGSDVAVQPSHSRHKVDQHEEVKEAEIHSLPPSPLPSAASSPSIASTPSPFVQNSRKVSTSPSFPSSTVAKSNKIGKNRSRNKMKNKGKESIQQKFQPHDNERKVKPKMAKKAMQQQLAEMIAQEEEEKARKGEIVREIEKMYNEGKTFYSQWRIQGLEVMIRNKYQKIWVHDLMGELHGIRVEKGVCGEGRPITTKFLPIQALLSPSVSALPPSEPSSTKPSRSSSSPSRLSSSPHNFSPSKLPSSSSSSSSTYPRQFLPITVHQPAVAPFRPFVKAPVPSIIRTIRYCGEQATGGIEFSHWVCRLESILEKMELPRHSLMGGATVVPQGGRAEKGPKLIAFGLGTMQGHFSEQADSPELEVEDSESDSDSDFGPFTERDAAAGRRVDGDHSKASQCHGGEGRRMKESQGDNNIGDDGGPPLVKGDQARIACSKHAFFLLVKDILDHAWAPSPPPAASRPPGASAIKPPPGLGSPHPPPRPRAATPNDLPLFAADPSYAPSDVEALRQMGCRVCPGASALCKVDSESVVVALGGGGGGGGGAGGEKRGMPWPLKQVLADMALPAIMVLEKVGSGWDADAETCGPDPNSPRVLEWMRQYDEIDFGADASLVGDARLYVRGGVGGLEGGKYVVKGKKSIEPDRPTDRPTESSKERGDDELLTVAGKNWHERRLASHETAVGTSEPFHDTQPFG
ncbi:hypothetical protein MKZ38_009182 [Zalerion maritima]|uniref:Uncharacterized protein n=1 Tax=Zalerion maritima TaxID=339359 RepID=A0AAD5WT38_9PEZI|nr:hypothetical protein MKZ38_009182 [Zalerion maritima]